MIAVTALFQTDCYSNPAESGTVRIKVRHSNEAIRQELLSYTPLGSDAAAVLEFVHTRLYSGGFGSSIGIMPEAGIRVRLGDYFGGVFVRTVVDAGWLFDEDRKLRSIQIWRFTALGGHFPGNDPASKGWRCSDAKPGIAVILGEYGDDSRSRKSIRAVWSFDKEDRLEDIYIKRVKVRE